MTQKRKRGRKLVMAMPGTKASYTNVLLEDIRGQVKMIAEGQVSLREDLEKKIEAQGDRLSARIDVLELAVRQNSDAIWQNKEAIQELKEGTGESKEAIRELTEATGENKEAIRELTEATRQNREAIGANTEGIRQNSVDVRTLSDRIDAVLLKLDSKADARRVAELEGRVDRLERDAS